MARISDEDIEKVREATDIVELIGQHVVLQPKGGVFWGRCPFHGEKTPSFKVDPSTGLYYCFGCHKHGNVFSYLMETDSLTFREAVIALAERAHIDLKLDTSSASASGSMARLRALCEETASFYHTILRASPTDDAGAARAYLSQRSFNIEVAKKWRLGYAPGNGQLVAHLRQKGFTFDEMVSANVAYRKGATVVDRFFNRVMFPIADVSGKTIAFGGRVIGKGEPKYLNSSDTPLFHKSKNLFGLDKARQRILETKTALIVEGYTDVIALHEAGFTNAVATLGTALTAEHVKLLSRFAQRVVYVFDGDDAGIRAATRAVEFIDSTISIESSSNPMVLDVVILPGGNDPAEIVGQENGHDTFEACLKQAQPLVEFAIDQKLEAWDLARPEERQRAINDAVAVLVPLRGTVMATDYAQYIVDKLWSQGVRYDVSAVLDALNRTKAQPRAHFEAAGEQQTENVEQEESLFSTGPSATADERLAQEALLYMVRDKEARAYLLDALTGDEFCFQVYREIFQLISSTFRTADMAPLVGFLSEKFAGFDALVAGHSELLSDPEEVLKTVRELATRLKERALERRVNELTQALRNPARSEEEKRSMVSEIAEAQKRLLSLRSHRHQK